MSRAAFLPTPGDPFLLNLWFSFYPRWSDEIDRLYVYVNSDSPKEVIQYIKQLVEKHPKTFFIYIDHQIEHGEALRQMVQFATEDYIMFVEDDAFIFKPGKVEQCFSRLENDEVDAVGSKRGSCSPWLYDTASKLWEIDNSGHGDHGPNFWPNFFFAKRNDLLRVSNFGAKHWKTGEIVRPFGLEAPTEIAGDTFVEGSLDMRAQELRFGYVAQYHGNTDDIPDYMNQTGIWGPEAHWLHVGSLSSGFHGMLKPGYVIDREHFSTDQEKLELERRLVFYKWALALASQSPQLPRVKELYGRGLQRLLQEYGLRESRVDKRIAIYKEAMAWST